MKVIKSLLLFVFISGSLLTSCNNNKTKNITKIDTVSINADTISNTFSKDTEYFEVSRDLNITADSLVYLRDSIKLLNNKIEALNKANIDITKLYKTNREKLAIAEFKLLRIREYNRIAAKGNNVKFLRSWINRVINN